MKIKNRDEVGAIYFPNTPVSFGYYAKTLNNKVVVEFGVNTLNSTLTDALTDEKRQEFKTWGRFHNYISQLGNVVVEFCERFN